MTDTPRCNKTVNDGRHVCRFPAGHEGVCRPHINALPSESGAGDAPPTPLVDRVQNCSNGEIVAASNTLHDLLSRMHTPSIEDIVRAVIVAWLRDDHWIDELRASPLVSETNGTPTPGILDGAIKALQDRAGDFDDGNGDTLYISDHVARELVLAVIAAKPDGSPSLGTTATPSQSEIDHRMLDAARLRGTTAEYQENVIGPAARAWAHGETP